MGDGEKGHFDADEEVVESDRDFGGIGVRAEAGDEFSGDEGGDKEGLPEGEEEDSFDAEEFRYGSVVCVSITRKKKKKTRKKGRTGKV